MRLSIILILPFIISACQNPAGSVKLPSQRQVYKLGNIIRNPERQKRGLDEAAIWYEQAAREAEQQARESEQLAKGEEQQARESEQKARFFELANPEQLAREYEQHTNPEQIVRIKEQDARNYEQLARGAEQHARKF